MSLRDEIKHVVAGDVDDSAAARLAASRDASIFSVNPEVVVSPKDTTDIKALVKWAGNSPQKPSLTVRSGGSDMTGGPLGTSVIIDMPKYFQHLGTVEGSSITVQAGVWYRDLEAYLTPQHLILPPFPASKNLCTVGGMVANNAGGEKTLAYGKTADYVKKLNVVLSDGHEYTFEPLSRGELEAKCTQPDFEGRLYDRMFELLEKNYDALAAARPKVSKNSAGYALWDVWNRERQTFDLTRLFSGSQGTLGIITDITFRVVPPRPYTQMLVMFLHDLSPLTEVVKTTLAYSPEAFESFDEHTLKLALRFFPSLWRKMKTKNIFSLLRSFTPEMKMMMTGGLPELVLLAEFSGSDPAEVAQRVQAAEAALQRFPMKTHRTQSIADASKYWIIRRESFNLLRHHAKEKRTAPFIEDIIVRPEYLPAFLPRLNQILDKYKLTYTIAGHVGDGNFHIIPLMDPTLPDFASIIENLSEEVFTLTLEFGGSLTAEHSDGLIRSHYLEKMFGAEVYNLFVEVKNIFDPQNIFNPGKKVGSSWEFAKQHLAKN